MSFIGCFFSFLAFLLTANLTFAQQKLPPDVCAPQQIRDSRVAGRAFKITFKDGRQITIIGHNHGKRQMQQLAKMSPQSLSNMPQHKFDKMLMAIYQDNTTSGSEAVKRDTGFDSSMLDNYRQKLLRLGVSIDMVKGVLNYKFNNSNALSHAEKDYSFLVDTIQPHKDNLPLQFLGIEIDQGYANGVIHSIHRGRQKITKEYLRRKGLSRTSVKQKVFDKIILSSSTASIDFYLRHPQVWKRLIPKGTEATPEVDAFNEDSDSGEIHSAFENLIKVDKQFWKNKKSKEREAFKARQENQISSNLILLTYLDAIATNISSERLNRVTAYLRSRVPTYLHAAFARFSDAAKNRVSSILNRDRASAQFMVQQHQSGIHLVGGRHLSGTIKYLQEYCNIELASDADSTDVSSER